MSRPFVLRFGIPPLDRLIMGEGGAGFSKMPEGITLGEAGTATMCIVGPDGTGKSILGLHLASRYLGDCYERDETEQLPFVLYVSTDLNHSTAQDRLWGAFRLGEPSDRKVPFARESTYEKTKAYKIQLTRIEPYVQGPDGMTEFLLRQPLSRSGEGITLEVGFIDLARNTAGDDWAYLSRIIGLLPAPKSGRARHLVVVDAVEGFETLVGEKDAFGETTSRRSRIAQIMRLAASGSGKSNIMFIVEEEFPNQRLPEVFVTDFVIRLLETEVGGYVRRTIEVEKARGYAHARG